MDNLLAWTASAASNHRSWAGPLFFLFAFGESLAVVGTFIPATPILFLLGTLLGAGEIGLEVIPWAIAGAILGYWASWAIGWRFGIRLYRSRFFRSNRRKVAAVRLFFRRWGGPSLVFGRYVLGPFQSMIPLAAGVARFGGRSFHPWNVVSGVAWVFVVLTPGVLVGRGVIAAGPDSVFADWVMAAVTLVSVGAIVVALAANVLRYSKTSKSSGDF